MHIRAICTSGKCQCRCAQNAYVVRLPIKSDSVFDRGQFERFPSPVFLCVFVSRLSEEQPSALLKEMVDNCALGHPFQQWMIAFAKTTDFKKPTPQMLEMIQAFSHSWLQSRINEQGNKHLRDGEHRVNASKVEALA